MSDAILIKRIALEKLKRQVNAVAAELDAIGEISEDQPYCEKLDRKLNELIGRLTTQKATLQTLANLDRF